MGFRVLRWRCTVAPFFVLVLVLGLVCWGPALRAGRDVTDGARVSRQPLAAVGDELARGQATGGEASPGTSRIAVADGGANGTAQSPATAVICRPALRVTAVYRYYDVEGADPRAALASVRQR